MQIMKYEELSPLRKQLVAHIYKNIMEKVARMFLPSDVSILVEKGMGLFDIPSRNKCFLVNCLGKCRKGGIEKLLFRSIIAGSFSKYEAKRVLLRDVKCNEGAEPLEVDDENAEEGECMTENEKHDREINERVRCGGVRRTLERGKRLGVFRRERVPAVASLDIQTVH